MGLPVWPSLWGPRQADCTCSLQPAQCLLTAVKTADTMFAHGYKTSSSVLCPRRPHPWGWAVGVAHLFVCGLGTLMSPRRQWLNSRCRGMLHVDSQDSYSALWLQNRHLQSCGDARGSRWALERLSGGNSSWGNKKLWGTPGAYIT